MLRCGRRADAGRCAVVPAAAGEATPTGIDGPTADEVGPRTDTGRPVLGRIRR